MPYSLRTCSWTGGRKLFRANPWLCENEVLGYRKTGKASSIRKTDFDFFNLDKELNNPRYFPSSTGTSEASSECDDSLSNLLISEASSDCSEDLCLDIDGELDIHDSLFGDISSAIMNVLDKTDSTVLVNGDFDWCNTESQLSSDLSSASQDCNSCTETSPNHRKWQNLSNSQQVSLIESLSQIISSELGLREQLEVIRIISPSANVSPTDTEFVIDIESMNDEKLRKVQEYINLHAHSHSLPNPEDQFLSPKKESKESKKHRSQERRNRQKVYKQRQRKEYRQKLKERRSGLFVKEEVMSIAENSMGEDSGDIDILG